MDLHTGVLAHVGNTLYYYHRNLQIRQGLYSSRIYHPCELRSELGLNCLTSFIFIIV